MSSKDKVCIIIPTYNNEDKISRCLDSIVNQTYENIEIILINDGSTDSTPLICERYAHKYPFIKYYSQENQGVSATRNRAMEITSGDWITFVDADDYVDTHYIQYLIDGAKTFDSDIVVSRLIDNKGYKEYLDKSFDSTDGFRSFFESCDYCPIGGKMFRTQIIKGNRLKFDELIKQGEDTQFIKEFVFYSQSACTISKRGYYYLESNTATKIYPIKYNIQRIKKDVEIRTRFKEKYGLQLLTKFIRDIITMTDLALLSCVKYSSYKDLKETLNAINLDCYLEHVKPVSYKHQFLIWLLQHKHYKIYKFLLSNKL